MMSWLKKIFAKKVDERQEMDLLRIEHYSFWLMYFMLFIEIVIQGMVLGEHDKVVGEGIVFVAASAFLVIGCARKGVWTYQSPKVPGAKSYLQYSLIAGVLAGIIGVFNGLKWSPGNIPVLMANMIVMAAGTFVLTFIAFLILGGITRKREKKLEMEAMEDDEEDE